MQSISLRDILIYEINYLQDIKEAYMQGYIDEKDYFELSAHLIDCKIKLIHLFGNLKNKSLLNRIYN